MIISGIIHEVESESGDSDFSGSSSDFVPEGSDHDEVIRTFLIFVKVVTN